MAIRPHRRAALAPCCRRGGLLTLALLGALLTPAAGGAQPASPNQPLSIPTDRLPAPACPLVVPPELPALQPLRIDPAQVAAKNRRGCLSPADAIYGPDGCPLRLCSGGSGAFALPPPPTRGY